MSGRNSRYRNTGLNTLLEIRVLLCNFASYDSLTFVVESIFLWRTAQRVQEQHEGRGENYCLRHTHIYIYRYNGARKYRLVHSRLGISK